MSGKKIGVVLALDGERAFSQSAQNARKESANLKSELRKLTTEYDGNANSQEFLMKKQENLIRQTETYTKTLKNAKAGLENAQNVQKRAAQRYEELEKSLEEARKEQEKMISSGKDGSKECKEQEKKVSALEQAVEKQGLQCQKCEGKVSDWSKRVNDAENDLEKTNQALKKNTAYLEEAENTTDKCATSIDKFGKTAEGATETVSGWGEKFKDAFANKAMSDGLDLIKSGINEVKEVMLDTSAASAQLTASTGLSERAAKRYEAVMKQIKGDNFGQDYKDVADVMSQTIQIMGELDDSAMTKVTEGAITLRDTFDMDVNESIRAADVMMKTMGVDADTAFNLLAKGAQNGLDRSHELADNLTEYGSLWGQAGFSASEAFAIMDNGLQAGAYNLDKVNDFVKEFGISLSDGRIEENIGSFSKGSQDLFDKWKKGEATTSQVFYSIIGDLENMTNKQDALTLASNIWSALGEDNAMQVLTALNDVNDAYENVNGTMEKLQQTKYSDLGNAVSGLGAAIQEKLVTPLADLALPGITALAQGATDVINGIADAFDTPKTELDTFIDEIKESNDAVNELIQNAQDTVNGANADVANLEAYKQVLMDLNEQESLTEFQKYQLKNAVETLGNSVPGLTEAFDSETGTLTATNEQLEEMFKNAEAVAMQNALIKAQTDLYDANAQALINKAKADSAAEEATKARTEVEEKNQESMIETADTYGKYYSEYMDAVATEDKATKKQKEANEVAEKAKEELDTQSAALEDLNKQYGLLPDKTSEATDGMDEAGNKADETARKFDEYGNDITDLSDDAASAVTEASRQIVEAYDNMQQGIADAIENSISFFDEFSGGTEVTSEQIKANLDSQIEGIQNWSENMQTLAGEVGDGMSQEMYDALAQMGPESANLVQTLVDALNNGTGEFEEIAGKWSEAMQLKDQSEVVAEYTTAGKNMASGVAAGASENSEETKQAGVQIGQALSDGIQEGAEENDSVATLNPEKVTDKTGDYEKAGEKLGESVSSGIAEGVKNKQDVINSAISDAIKADGVKTNGSGFQNIGESVAEAIAEGVKRKADIISNAVSEAAAEAASNAQKAAEAYRKSGNEVMTAYSQGIAAKKALAAQQAGGAASQALAHVRLYKSGFSSAGSNMMAGMAAGINAGRSSVINAAANAAASALASAKARMGIHSPSSVFRDQVGKQITAGMALGISRNAIMAEAAADQMSKQVYNKATVWLSAYKSAHKKKNQIALKDEVWFWNQIRSSVKAGSEAYNDATASMIAAGVSKTKTTGSGKKQKKTKKDAETYYSEIYSAAEKYMSNMESLNDVSTKDQLAYWQSMAKQLKSGTTAWYNAQTKIKSIQAKIGTVSNMSNMLSSYKTYYDMSEKAEMDYWDLVRKNYTEGTEERLEADEKYLDAREKYYDKLTDLEDDYNDKVEEVDKKLKEDIAELDEKFKSSLDDRTKAIQDSFGLFDKFESESADGKTLLVNIKAQALGYEDWMQQIQELSGKGILNQDLMDELVDQGPEISAAIHALNSLTEEELKEYNQAYLEKSELARKQAEKDTEKLKKEIEAQTAELNRQAEKEKTELESARNTAVEKVNTALSSSMTSLANSARSIADDQTAKLIAAITGEQRKAGMESTASAASSGSASSGSQPAAATPAPAPAATPAVSEDKILKIINSGKGHAKSLTKKEKKDHVALWEYIVKKYGHVPTNSIYTKLAKELGVKVSKTVTSAQKNEILKKLKAKGYRSGGRIWDDLTWMDEELDTKGPEMIVRKSDNAILTRTKPGDEIINADTAANLAQIGKYSLDELKQLIQNQGAAAYLQNLHIPAGIAKANQLMDLGSTTGRTQNISTQRMEQMLSQMNTLLEECMPYIQKIGQQTQIVLDDGTLVGKIAEPMNRALTQRKARRR